ncbi:hypothetical protein BT63DRAFT_422446 [Microthyrium microscopicum]|uniref:Mid2 domain-containing protein n=1 Tax=Microthyrium microscopicum TaxID=703497 RepID=A0A6A6UIA3_9PEZI|nr:hypothetical protein BT63DRAFT_422446 [Microthyrium microscopicum]
MKLSSISLLQSTITLLALTQSSSANPLSALAQIFESAPVQTANATHLELKRQCANPCGYYGQLCCATGQTCTTDANNQAQCAGGAAATTGSGAWQLYTSTYVQTNAVTITSVYSSWIPSSTGAACNYAANESPCGGICCKSGFYCYASGTCAAAGNGGFTTTGVVVGTVPARPTTISGVVVTQTISPTTTMAFQTPVTTGATNGTIVGQKHGLSGGAIAGIVIGTLLGIALLFFLCACFCCFEAFRGLFALFGIGKNRKDRRRTSTVVEEDEYIRHHRHGNSAMMGAAAGGRRWHGSRRSSSDRYSRRSRPPPPKKSGGGGWMTALAAGAGTAALAGIFSRKKTEKRTEKSESGYTGSSYDYSYSYSETDSRDSRSRPPPGPRSHYTDRTRSMSRRG